MKWGRALLVRSEGPPKGFYQRLRTADQIIIWLSESTDY